MNLDFVLIGVIDKLSSQIAQIFNVNAHFIELLRQQFLLVHLRRNIFNRGIHLVPNLQTRVFQLEGIKNLDDRRTQYR